LAPAKRNGSVYREDAVRSKERSLASLVETPRYVNEPEMARQVGKHVRVNMPAPTAMTRQAIVAERRPAFTHQRHDVAGHLDRKDRT